MSFDMNRVRHLDGAPDIQWEAMSKLTFTTKVMPIFGLALLMAAAGVFFGQTLPRGVLFGVMGIEFVLVLTSGLWQRKEGLNKFLFFVYALFSGMTLVPILSMATHVGGLGLIAQALTVTTVTFGGLALYGLTTKRDFTNMGGFLFIACLALIAGSLLNALVFHSGTAGLLVSVLGVGLFSAFTVYDMSLIRRTYADEDYIGASLGLFINFIGLFTMILSLFTGFGKRDD